MSAKYGAIVVGGGPAGLTAAIALASASIPTTLVGKRPARPDNRTTALLAGSVTALTSLGVWDHCAGNAAPLRAIRIVDDTGRLWRAPEVKFAADEIGLDAFGYNVENRDLIAALEARARGLEQLNIIDDEVQAVEAGASAVFVRTRGGATMSAPLLVGADGRRSICRAAAGIEVDERSQAQVALTAVLSHTRPHHDTSTEFHTAGGPFTLVPMPGQRSSLVWVMSSADAAEIGFLDVDELAFEIERRAHSILGKMALEPGRGQFPLAVAVANKFADKRIALIGEAAHVMPPIGAQGLNLGLRDAAMIGELAITAHRAGNDIGSPDTTARYDAARRADIGGRTLAIDLFNRSLLSDFLPIQGARGFGLYMLDRIGPLRRAVMREGVAPAAHQPRLMRGEAL